MGNFVQDTSFRMTTDHDLRDRPTYEIGVGLYSHVQSPRFSLSLTAFKEVTGIWK